MDANAYIACAVELTTLCAGDLAEQHPVILETLLFAGVGMLIPESWILRPLLSLFGFGPYGPVKGQSYPMVLVCELM